MKLAFGSDHAGIDLKNALMEHAKTLGHEVVDLGCYEKKSVDYPVYGYQVAKAVASGDCALGIAICGTGIGISLAANKVKGIRAFTCSEPYSARMAREHNNANVLCMGARVVGDELAKTILETYLATDFAGGRHARRVDLITAIEENGTL